MLIVSYGRTLDLGDIKDFNFDKVLVQLRPARIQKVPHCKPFDFKMMRPLCLLRIAKIALRESKRYASALVCPGRPVPEFYEEEGEFIKSMFIFYHILIVAESFAL